MCRNVFGGIVFLLLGACSPDTAPPEGPGPLPSIPPLPIYFDCIANEGRTVIAAHRGGPRSGYPENALETLKETWKATGAILEVDVSTSADGILFLHHDDYLGRTTTGRGRPAEATWEELRQLSLKDANGSVTGFGLATLADALEWADGRAILELDIKRGTDYDDVARIVRQADAEDRVILISYTDGQARALRSRFPKSVISVSVDEVSDIADLTENGFRIDQILAWTGTEYPDADLIAALDAQRIEAISGTLGRDGSLDGQAVRSGNDAVYTDISLLGVDMIATDRPLAAQAALASAGREVTFDTCRDETMAAPLQAAR